MTGPHVTVAVLTYRRPDDLVPALDALLPQVRAVPGARLLVVDNDVTDSARPTVEGIGHRAAGLVWYVHEPRPGIAAARNRALDDAATAGTDVVVFVDDDERPRDGWLAALLAVHERYGGVGVAGPVVSSLPSRDPWIESGGFFTRLRHVTGTRVEAAATNNLLLDAGWLARNGLRFDEAFGLSGGSDTVLTLRISALGGALYWCDEAVVEDVVPPHRFTRRWVLRRAYRMGNSTVRARVSVQSGAGRGLAVRAGALGAGGLRVAGGVVRAAVGVLDGRGTARGVRTTARGAGMVAAALGMVHAEYSRPKELLL